jgi:hypothetical protein
MIYDAKGLMFYVEGSAEPIDDLGEGVSKGWLVLSVS